MSSTFIHIYSCPLASLWQPYSETHQRLWTIGTRSLVVTRKWSSRCVAVYVLPPGKMRWYKICSDLKNELRIGGKGRCRCRKFIDLGLTQLIIAASQLRQALIKLNWFSLPHHNLLVVLMPFRHITPGNQQLFTWYLNDLQLLTLLSLTASSSMSLIASLLASSAGLAADRNIFRSALLSHLPQ